MRRNLRPYGYPASEASQQGGPRQRGLRSPRFIAGVSLVLALIAVALSVVALVLALPDSDADADGAAEVVEATAVGPAARTVAMVDQAIRHYNENGWAETVEFYLSPWSMDGAWHVFIVSPQDRIVASQDQSLLGHSIERLGRDYFGNSWGDIEIPDSGRWVHQHAWHPVTGWPTVSRTWVVRHDGYVFGSAWYE